MRSDINRKSPALSPEMMTLNCLILMTENGPYIHWLSGPIVLSTLPLVFVSKWLESRG